jgi:MarR family
MTRRVTVPTSGLARDRRSPCVCNTLRMVTRVVTQLYDDALRPSGLRVTQFGILATLGRLGGANLKQLEERLAIDQTTLTRSLNLLERDGVIERSANPDGRIKAMRLPRRGDGPSRSRGRSGPGPKTRSFAT